MKNNANYELNEYSADDTDELAYPPVLLDIPEELESDLVDGLGANQQLDVTEDSSLEELSDSPPNEALFAIPKITVPVTITDEGVDGVESVSFNLSFAEVVKLTDTQSIEIADAIFDGPFEASVIDLINLAGEESDSE